MTVPLDIHVGEKLIYNYLSWDSNSGLYITKNMVACCYIMNSQEYNYYINWEKNVLGFCSELYKVVPISESQVTDNSTVRGIWVTKTIQLHQFVFVAIESWWF